MDKNRVMEFFQNQQFEEAITYLSPVAAVDSGNLQVLGYLGYAHYMNENTEEAEKYFQRIVSIDPGNLSALGYLARLNTNKDPEKAKQYTWRLVTLQPGKAVWWRNMADLLHRTNQPDSAMSYYHQAYSLVPDDYRNAAGLAEILIEKSDFARADTILERGLTKDSLNISLLKLRIRSSYDEKEYEHALPPGERLMRLEETSVSPLTQVVLSYFTLKKYTDCIRVCEYMLNKGLELESIYYYEAKACSKLKLYAKSNELYETCLAKAISGTAEMYYYNLAENYEALKQYSKAVSQYDTAYYLFKNPVMNYNSGRIYESELNNAKLAQKYYALYLQTARPHSADEKKAYEYVKERWGKKKAEGGKTK
jgi:tetratricopeptide (TPR) repeat protein